MILGHIANLEQEKRAYDNNIRLGLEYLQKTDFSTLASGRYNIDGNNLFALVQSYKTLPKNQRRAETHTKYIDIQYIVQGKELIGFAPKSVNCEILEDQLAEKDACFYKTVPDEIDLVLSAGMYAIFMPLDIHRPSCSAGEATHVTKVVLKIAADTIFASI